MLSGQHDIVSINKMIKDEHMRVCIIYMGLRRWHSGKVVKISSANAGDAREAGSIPGLGRSPGVGNDNPLQFTCLENPMDGGGWWATVHRDAESQT